MALKSSPVSLELNCMKTTSLLLTSDGPWITRARFCGRNIFLTVHQSVPLFSPLFLTSDLRFAGKRPHVGDFCHHAVDFLRLARVHQRGDVIVVVMAASQQLCVAGIQSDSCGSEKRQQWKELEPERSQDGFSP